jgi:IS1 family transposase
MAYYDANVRKVKDKCIQVDEIWCLTYAKQKNVVTTKSAPADAGDTWTWTAIDADTKRVVSYFVGGRDGERATWFMDDLASRLTNCVRLTSNGHKAYLEVVEGAFGCDVDHDILNKIYGTVPDASKGRYSPAVYLGAKKERIEGKLDPAHVSTSYVERNYLTMRMHMRRFTRLTNAFSMKVESHACAVALHMMYYHFVRVHSKLRMSPAMAAGVSDRLWEVADIRGIGRSGRSEDGSVEARPI